MVKTAMLPHTSYKPKRYQSSSKLTLTPICRTGENVRSYIPLTGGPSDFVEGQQRERLRQIVHQIAWQYELLDSLET